MRIRRPVKLDDPVLRARERVPLRPFILIRTSVFQIESRTMKEGGGRERFKTLAPGGFSRTCRVCDAHSTKEKRVCTRQGLHRDFDGPGITIIQ
jgi:hypothetical protein